MGVNWQKQFENLIIPGDGAQCFEIDVPPRGNIRTMVMVELEGGTTGFTFEMFTKREVCPPSVSEGGSSLSSSSSAAVLVAAKELYSVFGVKDAASEVFSEFGARHPYETEGGSSNRSRKLYLRINPKGAEGAHTYQLKLVIEGPDLGG